MLYMVQLASGLPVIGGDDQQSTIVLIFVKLFHGRAFELMGRYCNIR